MRGNEGYYDLPLGQPHPKDVAASFKRRRAALASHVRGVPKRPVVGDTVPRRAGGPNPQNKQCRQSFMEVNPSRSRDGIGDDYPSARRFDAASHKFPDTVRWVGKFVLTVHYVSR